MYSNTALKFKALKCCVLLPTYNNAGTIETVVRDVLTYCDDVCVVNDGSKDNTLVLLAKFPVLKVLSYTNNVGKGWALRQGFKFAVQQGYEYAITMDTDGQHYASDLPVMLEALEKNKNAIVIGARNMEQSTVPGKSSFGNKFSNFWFTLETGITLPDTQSGYRLYPIKKLEDVKFFTRKYEFEIEVIVRGAWSGLDVIAVPVQVYYPPAEERISHFRPFKDFTRISILNTVLVFWTFVWIKPRDFFRSFKKKNWNQLLNEHLIRPHESPAVKASSVALGVFFGISPFWGFQMWLVLLVAFLFRLNKAIAVLASNVSIPPMIPLVVFLSYETGMLWMGSHGVHMDYDSHMSLEGARKNFIQYILGSLTLAAILSFISWWVSYLLIVTYKSRKANA